MLALARQLQFVSLKYIMLSLFVMSDYPKSLIVESCLLSYMVWIAFWAFKGFSARSRRMN